jgi:UDP-N-acetyl-D-galactosamine dehydrogenase
VRRLEWLGHSVDVADPLADAEELRNEHSRELAELDGRQYDLVVAAVPHQAYRDLADDQLVRLLSPGGTLADIKGIWRDRKLDPAIDRWSL